MRKFFRPPNRNTEEKVVASRSDLHNEKRQFMIDGSASLHMISKDARTVGEREAQENRVMSPSSSATDDGGDKG